MISSNPVNRCSRDRPDPLNSALIQVQNLSYQPSNSPKLILQDVSFELRPHQTMAIIGPNGSGKTTLLKLILNLLTPTQGRVWIQPHLSVAYIPQKLQFNPYLPITVQSLLALTLPKTSTHHDLDQVLDQVQAKSLKSQLFRNLSGGEKQRVLLARALLKNPDVLILDEPTQGMDIHGQTLFYELIGNSAPKPWSVLYVSHDLHMVLANTDWVICLNQHVCCSGTPQDLGEDPVYRGLFGFSLYEHRHDHIH
jgi:zinc transport system ATP-binding protein